MKKFGLFLLMLLMVSGLVLGGCATEPETPQETTVTPTCGDPVESVWKGGWAMDCGYYDQAIELLNCGIDSGQLSDKLKAIAHNYRGLAYYYKGDCKAAIDDFTVAINMFPLYDAAYRNRAYANWKCGNNAAAQKDMAMFNKLKARVKTWKPGPRMWPKGQCDTFK